MKEIIKTENAPAAIGAYSQAVKADKFIFVSGQLGIDPVNKKFKGETVEEQTEQALENAKAILAEKGYTLDDVVKTTVLLDDIDDFKKMNEIYAQFFTQECPARAAFEVANLPLRAKVEIELIAYK